MILAPPTLKKADDNLEKWESSLRAAQIAGLSVSISDPTMALAIVRLARSRIKSLSGQSPSLFPPVCFFLGSVWTLFIQWVLR